MWPCGDGVVRLGGKLVMTESFRHIYLAAVQAEDGGGPEEPQDLPAQQALRQAVPHRTLPHVFQALHQPP